MEYVICATICYCVSVIVGALTANAYWEEQTKLINERQRCEHNLATEALRLESSNE